MTEPARHLKVLCRIMPNTYSDSCIIPCPEARTIIASSKPINKQLLSIRSQKNISALKSSLMEDSTLVRFDGVLDEHISQSKLFTNWIKAPTQDLLTGKSLTVIVFGTTGSGKSYTIRGGEGKKRGQALRTVELLLSFVDKYRGKVALRASVVGIFQEKMVDLLQKESPPFEVSINKSSDFHAALNQALKMRKGITDKQNKDKIHMIVNLKLYQDNELLAEANFVELAGSEYAREDKQVARGFNAISSLLTNIYSNWQFNPLATYLKKTMNIHEAVPGNVVLICCATQSHETFPDTLASLKFTSRIKECLEKECVRPELVQIDNIIFGLSNSKVQEGEFLLENLENTVKRFGVREKLGRTEGFKNNLGEGIIDLQIRDTGSKGAEETYEKRLISEISMLKFKYSQLQEQYSIVLEEKSQLTTTFAILQSQLLDDLMSQCKDLNKVFRDEQELREKLIVDCKSFRKILLSKTPDRDHSPCTCSEDLKSLQKMLKDITDERQKLYERLELSLKENRSKEDHIQTLTSSSATYEQQTQNLNSIVSEYEQLIYDLQKSLNFMSGKLSQIEEEKLNLFRENEKLKNSFKGLRDKVEDQQMKTDKEIFKYKEEAEEKYENLLSKIEMLNMELCKVKLNNSHLIIQNKNLESQLGVLNNAEIDRKVGKVYEKIEELVYLCKLNEKMVEEF